MSEDSTVTWYLSLKRSSMPANIAFMSPGCGGGRGPGGGVQEGMMAQEQRPADA